MGILLRLSPVYHRNNSQNQERCLLEQFQFWPSLKCEACLRPRSKHLIVASVLSVSTMMAYKIFVADPRKQTYAEFYRNYDVEKEYGRMREAGIFTSIRPSDE